MESFYTLTVLQVPHIIAESSPFPALLSVLPLTGEGVQSSPCAQHWWASASLPYPPDSQRCHVLERALTINNIPGFVCYAKRLCCLYWRDRRPRSSVNKTDVCVRQQVDQFVIQSVATTLCHSRIRISARVNNLTVPCRGLRVVPANLLFIRDFKHLLFPARDLLIY